MCRHAAGILDRCGCGGLLQRRLRGQDRHGRRRAERRRRALPSLAAAAAGHGRVDRRRGRSSRRGLRLGQEHGAGAAASGGAAPDGGAGASGGAGGGSSGDDAAAGAPAARAAPARPLRGLRELRAPADLRGAWTTTVTAATLTVDTTKAAHGTKALHIKAAAGTPVAVIAKQDAPLFPIAGNVIYGRVMMWLTATPGGDYHWNNIQAAGDHARLDDLGQVRLGRAIRQGPRGLHRAHRADGDHGDDGLLEAFDVGVPQPEVGLRRVAVRRPEERRCTSGSTARCSHGRRRHRHGHRCVSNADLGKPWNAPTSRSSRSAGSSIRARTARSSCGWTTSPSARSASAALPTP